MEKQPKYRLGQLVMLLDHNPKGVIMKSTDPGYRIDTGKVVKITKIVREEWKAFHGEDPIQYSYEVTPGYQCSFFDKVHELWLRPLTGQEITGRI